MILRNAIHAIPSENIDSASKTIRAGQYSTDKADYAVIMLTIAKIGSPGGSDTIIVSPLFIDESGNEHIDSDTTYGTVTITGSLTNLTPCWKVPYLTRKIGLKITGSSGLDSTTGFIVSAWIELVGNTNVPGTKPVWKVRDEL